MEEIIDEIITRKRDSLQGHDCIASEIATLFREFEKWKERNIYYVPRFEDTDTQKCYLYIWWNGLEIENRHYEFFSFDELFSYWYSNVRGK